MTLSRDRHVTAQRMPFGPPSAAPCPHARDSGAAVLAWQGHLAARRIGTPTPISPEQRANLVATERALGLVRSSAGAVR